MRALTTSLILIGIAGTIVTADTPQAANTSRCAFADDETMTSLGICYLVAEHYVVKEEWPIRPKQIEQQARVLFRAEGIDEEKASEFLGRFSMLEMTTDGSNLQLNYRFEVDGECFAQRVTFYPRPTVDEILQSITGEYEDAQQTGSGNTG